MSGAPAFEGPTGRRADGQFVDSGPSEGPFARLSDHPLARPSDRRRVGPPEPIIVAESPAMRRAVDLARRFAPLTLPVLLLGETGTGKEVLAQAIHRWSGRRGELVDVDCGALPQGMVVAELFGHRKGAYTTAVDSMPGLIEEASHGTLFLDELASLGPETQAALLRVLETGEVRRVGDRTKRRLDIRLIGALQDRREESTPENRLRPDLYHRLAGTVIYLPPLRDRPEDLMPLARYFASLLSRGVSESAEGLLRRYHWPGNARELRNAIIRAVSLTMMDELTAGCVAEAMDLGDRHRPRPVVTLGRLSREQNYMLDLGRRHAGRPEAMAAELGVSRSTLYRRLREMGISLRGFLREFRNLEGEVHKS